MTSFPLCRKHKVLRKSRQAKYPNISTTALYELLGNERYQQCCPLFVYETNYPRPDEVERFLRRAKL